MLEHVRFLLENKKTECRGFNFVAGSLTALAAFAIKGVTLHSAFKIPVSVCEAEFEKRFSKELSADEIKYYRSIRFLLIDEIGTLGKKHAAFINQKLRQADKENAHLPFAGRSILMAGDFSQLQPVGK